MNVFNAHKEDEYTEMKKRPHTGEGRQNISNDLYFAQEQLREKLHTRVTIAGTEERGKLTIEYFSKDALDYLYLLLMEQK